jgi:hypothetical protein
MLAVAVGRDWKGKLSPFSQVLKVTLLGTGSSMQVAALFNG